VLKIYSRAAAALESIEKFYKIYADNSADETLKGFKNN
jgi:hypothetical protein